MLQEYVKDAVIVHYILQQPIAVPYARNDITWLASSLNFDERGIPSSCLTDALQEYIAYPDPTETLIDIN